MVAASISEENSFGACEIIPGIVCKAVVAQARRNNIGWVFRCGMCMSGRQEPAKRKEDRGPRYLGATECRPWISALAWRLPRYPLAVRAGPPSRITTQVVLLKAHEYESHQVRAEACCSSNCKDTHNQVPSYVILEVGWIQST